MFNLFRRRPGDATIRTLYGAIVAQARHPEFYAGYGVPDTVDGRFDMIVLHLALLVRRLRHEAAARELGQAVFDAFCADMDHNLREMGVSDIAVPRRMRRLGEAFYGRAAAYDRALDAGDPAALAAALGRNVFPRDEGGDGPARLAAYVRQAGEALAAQETAALAEGRLMFPDPATIMGRPGPE